MRTEHEQARIHAHVNVTHVDAVINNWCNMTDVGMAGLGLVVLDSPDGQRWLGDCVDRDTCCTRGTSEATTSIRSSTIVGAWRKQKWKTYCGLTSIAIGTTACSAAECLCNCTLDSTYPHHKLSDTHVVSDDATPNNGWVDEDDIAARAKLSHDGKSLDSIRQSGLTLIELEDLVMAVFHRHAVSVRRLHALPADVQEQNTHPYPYVSSLDRFRDEIKTSLISKRCCCIVNYHMSVAGQNPFGGHFSPIAGYNALHDSCLIADTWYETEPVWISLSRLWTACTSPDSETKLARGLLIFKFTENDQNRS